MGPPPWNGTVTKSRPRASLSISIDSDGEFSDGLHHMLSCAEENGCLRASMLGWNTGIQLRGIDGTNRGTKLMRTGRSRCKKRQKVRALFPNRSSSLFSELPDRGQAEVPRARERAARVPSADAVILRWRRCFFPALQIIRA